MLELRSPLQAHIVQLLAQPGQTVQAGQVLLVLEAMKMEHEVLAPHDGVVRECFYAVGESVAQDEVLVVIERSTAPSPRHAPGAAPTAEPAVAPGAGRADLARVASDGAVFEYAYAATRAGAYRVSVTTPPVWCPTTSTCSSCK